MTIGYRMRSDLDRYAAAHRDEPMPEPGEDNRPWMALAAVACLLSSAVSFWVLYRVIEWIVNL